MATVTALRGKRGVKAVKQTAKKAKSRPATYRTPIRFASVMYDLLTSPAGMSLEGLKRELQMGKRTTQRYVAALLRLTDGNGRRLFERHRYEERIVIRRAEHIDKPKAGATAFRVLSLYVALTLLKFLEGTVIAQGADDVWRMLSGSLEETDRRRLQNFERKFYAIQFAVKDYRSPELDDILNEVVSALVYQNRMRIRYGFRPDQPRDHLFEPYTLVIYRGGLYVIGRSHRGRKIITLALERILEAERCEDKFDYPKSYSPEKYTEGTFGIMAAEDSTDVAFRILNPQTLRYLELRKLHPTQKLIRHADGTATVTLRVRGTEELCNFLLGFGPYVEVLRPTALRHRLRNLHAEAAALYRVEP